MKLHHTGFIVKSIDDYEKRMVFEEKIGDVIDLVQNARLTLYKNFGGPYVELIQPLNENAFIWNTLQKSGEGFNHFCYSVYSLEEVENIVQKFKLTVITSPVPAKLFGGKQVVFYYAKNRQIVEFLIDEKAI